METNDVEYMAEAPVSGPDEADLVARLGLLAIKNPAPEIGYSSYTYFGRQLASYYTPLKDHVEVEQAGCMECP